MNEMNNDSKYDEFGLKKKVLVECIEVRKRYFYVDADADTAEEARKLAKEATEQSYYEDNVCMDDIFCDDISFHAEPLDYEPGHGMECYAVRRFTDSETGKEWVELALDMEEEDEQ